MKTLEDPQFWRDHTTVRLLADWAVIITSVLLCLLMSPLRLPGLQLARVSPDWLLIWVVVWSVKRRAAQGAIAGLVLGWLQDSLTAPYPTHTIGLVLVGIFTARFQKQRYIKEDFVSISLITFGMVLLAEIVVAIQFLFQANRPPGEVWIYYQQIALSSSILSSLWAPVLYYPLNQWWERIEAFDRAP